MSNPCQYGITGQTMRTDAKPKRRAKKTTAAQKAKSRAQARRNRLWKLFRISPEEYDAILAFQWAHPVFSLLLGKHLGLDHRHSSGLVAGLLEWRINRAYGMIEAVAPRNTSDVLRALAEYHDNPPAVTALGGPRYGLLGKAMYKRKMIYGGPQLRDTTTKRRKKS